MKPTNDLLKNKAFTIKGSLFTISSIRLFTTDINAFSLQLKETLELSPTFFNKAPILVDLQAIADSTAHLDLLQIYSILRSNDFIPIGIVGGNNQQQQYATDNGLAVFASNQAKPTLKSNAPVPNNICNSAQIIDHPVRSGQQIYATNQDLIITSTVNPGAEVIADGNIHIYGALNGKAIAGAKGNKNARIFCAKLAAELVSIAGVYKLNDGLQLPIAHGMIQIMLAGEQLQIRTIQ